MPFVLPLIEAGGWSSSASLSASSPDLKADVARWRLIRSDTASAKDLRSCESFQCSTGPAKTKSEAPPTQIQAFRITVCGEAAISRTLINAAERRWSSEVSRLVVVMYPSGGPLLSRYG
ncbi:hypothetical protein KC336_g91 [Hortaea werneckii]|nr:hypothetical protein KC336_g91 [Hortaea werneckii]